MIIITVITIDMKCDDPPVPSNGDFISNGTVVTYMCEERFVLVGNRQRFCNLTTWLWNGSDPICEGINMIIVYNAPYDPLKIIVT